MAASSTSASAQASHQEQLLQESAARVALESQLARLQEELEASSSAARAAEAQVGTKRRGCGNVATGQAAHIKSLWLVHGVASAYFESSGAPADVLHAAGRYRVWPICLRAHGNASRRACFITPIGVYH